MVLQYDHNCYDDICRLCLLAAFVLDTGLCQAGSQQLCISKFTFACICLAFCSLSMTTFCSILPAVVCIFTLITYIHIVNPLCTQFTYCIFCHGISYRLNLIYNIFVVEVSQIILEFAILDLDISAPCIKGNKVTAILAIHMFFQPNSNSNVSHAC